MSKHILTMPAAFWIRHKVRNHCSGWWGRWVFAKYITFSIFSLKPPTCRLSIRSIDILGASRSVIPFMFYQICWFQTNFKSSRLTTTIVSLQISKNPLKRHFISRDITFDSQNYHNCYIINKFFLFRRKLVDYLLKYKKSLNISANISHNLQTQYNAFIHWIITYSKSISAAHKSTGCKLFIYFCKQIIGMFRQ